MRLGRAGRHVRPEVIELISSGPTEAARAMTMRLVAGDIGALKEINETAVKLQGLHRRLDGVEQHQRVSIEFGGADRGLFDEVGELRISSKLFFPCTCSLVMLCI
mgnify:CR=1 FL=1